MALALQQCPKCEWPVAYRDAVFCDNCGCDLALASREEPPTAQENESASTRGVAESAFRAPASTELAKPRIEGRDSVVPGVTTVPIMNVYTVPIPIPSIPPVPKKAIPTAPSGSDGELDVAYNVSRIFIEELEMPFQFRFIAKCEGISSICVEIRRKLSPYAEDLVARDEPSWVPVPGREMDNPIGFTPRSGSGGAGQVTFEIYVGYQVDGVQKWFTVRKLHPIFERKTKVGAVIQQLNVQFSNEVKQGHAGDVQVRQTLDGIEKLAQHKHEQIEDFRGLDVPELWVQLPLCKCHYKPIQHGGPTHRIPPAEALKKRLTLTNQGSKIHLLANSTIQLGRHKENDIVARLFNPDESCLEKASAWISRYHCRIKLQDDCCTLEDKGWYPEDGNFRPSAYGTMLDHQLVPKGKSLEIAHDRDFTITLAKQKQDSSDIYVLEGRLWTVGALGPQPKTCREGSRPGDLAALVLRRKTGTDEIFVVLLKSFCFGRLGQQFGNLWVCRCEEAFSVSMDGRCDWLIPGRQVSSTKGIIQVSA